MKKFTLLVCALFCLGIVTVKAQYWVLLGFNGTNGALPYGALTVSGNTLFGMTLDGGMNGDGNVFSIRTDGSNYKDLHDFSLVWVSSGPNGNGSWYKVYYPFGSLTLSGNRMYGMTWEGGTAGGFSGNIFSIDTNGNAYNDLYEMQLGKIGWYPYGDLTLCGNKFYGTTSAGIHSGFGYIFSMNANTSVVDTLFDFNGSDRFSHNADLTTVAGLLYGMTQSGGVYGKGNIFSIDTTGNNYRDLYDFNTANYVYPSGELTYSTGVLYGVTSYGGVNDSGSIFSIDTNGSNYKDLFDFDGPNGKNPVASLTLLGNRLYGMTPYGGQKNQGVVFT
ncbi:MAG TPA: choice-of-anchor tandem repeat GloVer-containing protein, partial [Bacteroidia bacterium]|nr:choice-of-anchor tandem repeat GloVer-containing protein [Bacteroidia bacterium]